jgi:hypothetical protein
VSCSRHVKDDFEYYLQAEVGKQNLSFPAAGGSLRQTVVVTD